MSRRVCIIRAAGGLAILAGLAIAVGCEPAAGPPSATMEMTALAERVLPIWNEGDLDVVDELYAPEFVRHAVGIFDDLVGPEGLKAYVTEVRTTYSDFQLVFDEIVVAGDMIVTRWTATGVNTGEAPQGMPPTGKPMTISGASLTRVADGRIVEEWAYWNMLAVWQQLGYTLAPPAEEAPE